MKNFIDEYRKFRHLVREEIGDLSEEDIMMLFSLYLERPQYKNPFAGLETFFSQYSSLFNSNMVIQMMTLMTPTLMTTRFQTILPQGVRKTY